MEIHKEVVIAQNLEFFEMAMPGLAARHFFAQAIECTERHDRLSLAGVTCIICGIEGALRFALNETAQSSPLDDLDGGQNLNHDLLKCANRRGFDIEVLAFPEEKGRLLSIVEGKDRCGIVMWRNEFAHGRVYRLANLIGDYVFDDPLLLGPAFAELINISHDFAVEMARFRNKSPIPQKPMNPLSF